jgi:hypothetical protein
MCVLQTVVALHKFLTPFCLLFSALWRKQRRMLYSGYQFLPEFSHIPNRLFDGDDQVALIANKASDRFEEKATEIRIEADEKSSI